MYVLWVCRVHSHLTSHWRKDNNNVCKTGGMNQLFFPPPPFFLIFNNKVDK